MITVPSACHKRADPDDASRCHSSPDRRSTMGEWTLALLTSEGQLRRELVDAGDHMGTTRHAHTRTIGTSPH